MRHFIVGTGGRGLYDINSAPPGMEASQDTTFGVLKLTLNPASYSWQFLPVAGGSYSDSGSSSCRGQSAPDSDGDGWSNSAETTIGTNPNASCGTNAWPVDIDNNGSVDMVGDVSALANKFSVSVPPAPARYNISPEPPDGFVDIFDILRMTGLFGTSCAP